MVLPIPLIVDLLFGVAAFIACEKDVDEFGRVEYGVEVLMPKFVVVVYFVIFLKLVFLPNGLAFLV